MENVLLCTGKYAKKPYYFEHAGMNVYCVEELCYLLASNPFMIDAEIMDKELVKWLYEECELKELSHRLLQLFQRGCQPGTFVDTIMDYAGYCSKEDKERIDEVLRGSAGLGQYEKQKQQGDYLMKNGRYQLAVREYEKLLSVLPEAEKELIPSVYHNLGVACCRLFRFESGAAYLKKAYELSGREESGIQYLEAMREQLTEGEYVSFMADHREYYELSMKVEKLYEMARGQFEATRENRMLSALKIYRDEGNTGSYYEEIDKIIARLKDDYRESVAQ